mmetsp:Transcript_4850/g.7164  ORF Transcript_4850/g.7164 Transcript_4850/m.7164 type:complete len:399 (-) Transcript_4850:80-1276(-)|eukprot:CAMPEP_0203676596 /NCGR_PEP_ID=MMETSP0090-20130426/25062_1 /ASSEMBLY_ACC=CAM_ASM_001088 /TAXON_ID=426623 /ORGANISM="Chaetoceros affinis, Strain CCMP159" /LENGTH=398 /DNA_ID=CAMNT_0050543187 /DNA_START=1 /DNA_END=1197 /DNA_ORIENTATION=+
MDLTQNGFQSVGAAVGEAFRGGGQQRFIKNNSIFFLPSLSLSPLSPPRPSCSLVARKAVRIAGQTAERTSIPMGSSSNTRSSISNIGIFSILSILPPPSQILFATLVSLSLSEAFNYLGLFHDENGIRAKEAADQFFERHKQHSSNDTSTVVESILSSLVIGILDWVDVNVREEGGLLHLPTIVDKIEYLVQEGRNISNGSNTNMNTNTSAKKNTVQWQYQWRRWKRRIQNMPFKHQFAIGTTLGMILHSGSVLISKVALITYMLSEVSYNIISNYDEEEERPGSNGDDKEYFPYGIAFSNGGNDHDGDNIESFIDAEILFEHLKDIRIFTFRCLKYVNKKLNWFRLGVRSILSSSSSSSSKKDFFHNVGNWIDDEDSGEGTIIVGFIFGVALGYLLS